MFKGAKLSQDLSVAKSYFECSNFGFQVQCTQLLTTKKKKKRAVILMLMQVAFCCIGLACFVTNGRNSHFFRLTAQYKALESEHTPHEQI